ncbi:transposase family protein [Streptomyces sp. RB17]|uniref:transposase family protein n=1 Tax=Streptomyces sp. RB17 TaxID=2585197 RepID=UPI002B1F4880|nr:transposase family protein [Streptomyces sp. RB17]
MPDPRARRGIRHPWTALLAAAAAAVLSGAASITAIGEWVTDAPQRVLALLGFRPDPLTGLFRPPHATTIRLVLAAADGDALDRAIGRYLQERQATAGGRRLIAVDGKTLRGSRTARRTATALIAAMISSARAAASSASTSGKAGSSIAVRGEDGRLRASAGGSERRRFAGEHPSPCRQRDPVDARGGLRDARAGEVPLDRCGVRRGRGGQRHHPGARQPERAPAPELGHWFDRRVRPALPVLPQ